MQKVVENILNRMDMGIANGIIQKEAAAILADYYRLAMRDADYLSSFFVNSIVAQSVYRKQISPDVEAVQIEWISNGILVRGKGADGAFCNYYRDTSAFVSQHLNGKTFDFVKDKEPKTGDKCVIYFGIADTDTE